MHVTNVAIAFDNSPSTQDSFALKELLESLEGVDISVKPDIDQTKVGVKDGGLMIGLTIAALAVSAIGTLVSAISLWGSKRNYSITFKTGEATFGANNLSAKETLAIAQVIKDKAVASDIEVLVSSR
jgi:hypothetical protein